MRTRGFVLHTLGFTLRGPCFAFAQISHQLFSAPLSYTPLVKSENDGFARFKGKHSKIEDYTRMVIWFRIAKIRTGLKVPVSAPLGSF